MVGMEVKALWQKSADWNSVPASLKAWEAIHAASNLHSHPFPHLPSGEQGEWSSEVTRRLCYPRPLDPKLPSVEACSRAADD